jgi:hypothetical protein
VHTIWIAERRAPIIGRAHQRRKRIIDRPPQAELVEPRLSLVRPSGIWQHLREDAAQG